MNPKTKLKNLKFEIEGTETPKQKYNLMIITAAGFILALVGLFLAVTFAEQIDNYSEQDADNGLAIVIILVGVALMVRYALKKYLL